MDQISIEVKPERNGEAVVYGLRGSFDLATAPSVRAALLESADGGKRDIIVDLSEVEFLDSTGLGALIGAHRRALEHGGCVRLVVREGAILRLLTITGLLRVFSVYESRGAALADRDRVAAPL